MLFIKTKTLLILTKQILKYILSDKKSHSKDSFKYFIGYRHEGNAFPSPLSIKLLQMNTYAKYFDKNSKYINHLIKDKKILKKYLKIWNIIESLIKN